MPIATTDEQLALQASIREWAKRAGTIDAVRGMEPGTADDDGSSHEHTTQTGSAAERWAGLAELGVFAIGLPAAANGAAGTPGDGWRVARTTLATERVAMGTGSSVGDAVEQLLRTAASTGADNDPVARQRLGALIAEGMAVSLLDLQAVQGQLRGTDPGPLAAVRKLIGTSHRQAVAEAALELTGSAAVAAPVDCAADADGHAAAALEEFLLTRCLSIAGGTTQILLSLVGERLLGLPREEAR